MDSLSADTRTLLIILIPSVLSILLTAAGMAFTHFRDKRKRAERIWDTAEAIALSIYRHDEHYRATTSVPDDAVVCFSRVYCLLKEVDSGTFQQRLSKHAQYHSRLDIGLFEAEGYTLSHQPEQSSQK